MTNTSVSSVSKAPVPCGRFGDFSHGKGELLGIQKFLAKAKEDSRTYSQGSCVFDPWAEKGRDVKQTNSVVTGYSSKPNGTSKPNRKRLKPGENPRPRPKDRQMIQDRVKELREIVPNSAKCSIDALLERTIKHMLFLQGVTKHADKLKQTAESKIIGDDGGLLLKDNSGGGATWAYEVGSQSMVCPIIVEDLNQPHQMLVEMLCEERGLFLEIADIIRGLGLTILKGLMENRNDKIWARFTVEANRNVTRMEIFLSLVRLLDQNPKTGIPQSDKIVREFNQAASGPTTGGCVGIC
ncbi:transcription factor lhw [Phtheirospermum japonicum]|uniref:Transcription factor lhw n=1 Tax=Phtheirospermum japonicum TaxID=374723 RepID=A0A830CRY7_9LAMI|nr:transcription factor lhw [Phtheirospermum japonicum]